MNDVRTVRANGLEFAYLEEGSGPLVLLLHGFPDNAYTWEHQMPALAAAGYRAVAPFLRGYPPTEVPANGFYDTGTLATDVRELIVALGGGDPAFLVGTDWGTFATFAASAAFPEVVRRAVIIAVPLPQAAAQIVTMPEMLQHTFYIWFFQLPVIPEVAVAANDFAFVDYLWRQWEPGLDDDAHIVRVKETLAAPGALEAALGYYRAMLDPARGDPSLDGVRARAGGTTAVPTMAIFGRDDPHAVFAPLHEPFFTGGFRLEMLDGCAHFLHRSRSKDVNEMIIDWLGEAI